MDGKQSTEKNKPGIDKERVEKDSESRIEGKNGREKGGGYCLERIQT